MALANKTEKEPRENVIVRTYREVRSEMKKVVWPTREETIRLTIVVIVISVIISIILFISDALFLTLLTQLQNFAARLVAGG
jgi:preprotein translocase subunit SecE